MQQRKNSFLASNMLFQKFSSKWFNSLIRSLKVKHVKTVPKYSMQASSLRVFLPSGLICIIKRLLRKSCIHFPEFKIPLVTEQRKYLLWGMKNCTKLEIAWTSAPLYTSGLYKLVVFMLKFTLVISRRAHKTRNWFRSLSIPQSSRFKLTFRETAFDGNFLRLKRVHVDSYARVVKMKNDWTIEWNNSMNSQHAHRCNIIECISSVRQDTSISKLMKRFVTQVVSKLKHTQR